MDGVLHVDSYQLRGASAEVVSVLRASGACDHLIPNGEWSAIAQALDTRVPPDERATFATNLLRGIQRMDPVTRWLPRFDQLPEHEFRQEFYPAYRDHTVHTLQVWLLGLYLFETVNGLREPLVSLLRSRSASTQDDGSLFRRWWTLAALWHDTGYPFESEDLTVDSNVRQERLKRLADAFSADGFQDGLRSSGLEPSPVLLAQFYRAGRHVPLIIDSVVEFLEGSDEHRIIDNLWRRLGLRVKSGDRAERILDDLTMKAPTIRPPYHDHGVFGALLLIRAFSSAETFLEELTSALQDPRFRGLASVVPDASKGKLDEAYLELLDTRTLIDMAAEAIAYHNFDFRTVDGAAQKALFQAHGLRPTADLKQEPHLVFLAIADTLQDWDRHHFRPQTPGQRPAVPSDQMLLQGYGGKIRVALEGQKDPAKRVRSLFSGWIGGADDIFADGAQFSRGNDIHSTTFAPTISAAEDSANTLAELRREIILSAERARAALVRSHPRAVIDAAEIIEALLLKAADARPKLTSTHQTELDTALHGPELQSVERGAVVAIRPGTLLPIGMVESRIGGGGFGEVFLVTDTNRSGSRSVAFKVFHGFELDNPTKRFYFERGFRAMESLRHEPGVVTVDRLLHVPFGMSMEFVAGKNLEEATKERPDVHVRLRLLERVAATLASAHNKGIIHRDVKPANVLLDAGNDGEPVLTDFDLAHISGKTTVASAYFASQLYGAPEQFNKRLEEWSRKPCVDVYGFGTLMYHVLTFRDPPLSGGFGAEQWVVVKQSLENSVPATVVSRLLQLFSEVTCPDPRQRLSSVDELQQMEYVVHTLAACQRESAFTGAEGIPWDEWVREVAYAVTGETDQREPEEFLSRSEGTMWRLEPRDGLARVMVTCTLNREPRFEGVNYKGFSRSSARQVDRALEGFGKIGKAPRATRHGQLKAAGSKMTVEVQQIELTRVFAHRFGELLSALARAVE